MTSLSYDDIYSRVLDKITDYSFLENSDSEIYEELNQKMTSALSKPYLRRLFSSIQCDDDVQVITYELVYPVEDGYDNDFIAEAIALGVVIEWLGKKVKSTNSIHQLITSSKESKWYNQKDHLNAISALYDSCKSEQRAIIRDRGYINNSYLDS